MHMIASTFPHQLISYRRCNYQILNATVLVFDLEIKDHPLQFLAYSYLTIFTEV